jgi:group I intron endonuclease
MEEAMHYLYKITNTENQKVYIGQTNNPDLRWSQHKSNAKYDRGNQVITRAMTKYGANVFQFEVIATCRTQEDVDLAEEEAIQQYDSRNREKGYNVDRGGNTSPRTSEVVAKISEALQKHYETHDGWLKGGTLTDEWKENISKASMGKAGTNIGKTFDDKWRMNISKSLTGKKFSEERIKKLSESHLGQIAPNRKLTLEQVKEIRFLYKSTKISQKELGKQFGLSQATIHDIVNNLTYKEV